MKTITVISDITECNLQHIVRLGITDGEMWLSFKKNRKGTKNGPAIMLNLCVFVGVREVASMLLHLETRYAAVLNNKTLSNNTVIVSFDQQFNLRYERITHSTLQLSDMQFTCYTSCRWLSRSRNMCGLFSRSPNKF